MQRSLHYDIVRILAFSMVILMHSPSPASIDNGAVLSAISYLTYPCIGLFFMLSGALLLKRVDHIEEFSPGQFLKKRFSKIFWPLLFWSGVGYLLSFLGVNNIENAVLWFMYVLAGLYLLVPILNRWLSFASRREVELYLLLWSITLACPYLNLVFEFNLDFRSWLFYFQGYVGYFLLGFYLRQYGLNRVQNVVFWLLLLFVSVALPICNLFWDWGLDCKQFFGTRTLAVAAMCVAWWKLIGRYAYLFERFRAPIVAISKLSFGIYLVHILVMRNFLWKLGWMASLPGVAQIPVCAVLTFVLSALFCWVVSKWRYSKYVIGV